MRPMQVERTYGKKLYLRPETSEKDDIISSKETKLVTDEFDITAPIKILKNHPIENVIGELIEGKKTRDNKSGLKPAPRAWYERLTNFFD